jgi:DedD protein
MAGSQDTEITLGPGKVLAIFFGLVALCALCFGLGYRMGSASVLTAGAGETVSPAVAGGARPSAARPDNRSSSSSARTDKKRDASEGAGNAAVSTPAESANPTDPTALPPVGNAYYVQVAAVSKQEDAEALVEALKRKQYPALTASPSPDKLFHVQVGPFAEVKDAEAVRTKLVSDGYNPILKK